MMKKNVKYLIVFTLILFVGLGVACASEVDDTTSDIQDVATTTQADTATTSQVMSSVETITDEGNLAYEDDVGENTDPGANPIQYNSISQTSYTNAVITLSDDQSFTDGVATFNDNVTLNSDNVKRTLNNFKIIVSGHNITINNVAFSHQTNTATKVIDVTSGASDVLIDNVDISLTKNAAVTTMGISVSDNADNVVVNGSSVEVCAVPQGLWHQDEDDNWYNQLMVSGVTVDMASNVEVANSTIRMTNSVVDSVGGTMPAVTIEDQSSNVKLFNNTINSTGATYNYGVMCADYVNNLNITANRVNVTGVVYDAGMDVSTSVNSVVKYNNITVNSTNTSVLSSGSEALAYGIITDTYQVNNTNNVVSYNKIDLVANVAYGLENYMGSSNTFEYNNVTINAKRGLGIATNASSSNYYRFNKIDIDCNDDDINYFYETIPAQNVGIIIIGANNNYLQYNNITITEDSTNTDTYAIILADDTSTNTVKNNTLYVYNTNGISKYGQNAVSNHVTSNNVKFNLPTAIPTLNNLITNKNAKKDTENTLIINSDNLSSYGMLNSPFIMISSLPANTYITLDVDSIANSNCVLMVQPSVGSSTIQIISSNFVQVICPNVPIVDTILPYATIQSAKSLNDSVFFTTSGNTVTSSILYNSTVFSLDENYVALDSTKYGTYFDSNTNILSENVREGSTIVLRNYNLYNSKNNFNKPIIINKPVNITSFDNTVYVADITFVAGSEGSNITGLTLNGNLYINTSGITVRNNTIANTVFVKDTDGVVIEQNTFNTESTPIVLEGVLSSTIRDNNITTTGDYTITLDGESAENTITGNDLIASTLQGDNSILDNGQDNSISQNTPIVYTPELKVETTEFSVGSSATITASIYLGDEVDASVNKGKVVFKVNGKTLKDQATGKVLYAKVTGGVASISDYEVPTSWANDDTTITAVYSGSSDCVALSSEATALTVTASTPSITFSDISAAKGETVTLTATVSDGDNLINTGKVVFKVNGKTVKDANGKVIYAKVTGGVASVTYTVPDSMKAGNYTITAVFTAPDYDKLTASAVLSVGAGNVSVNGVLSSPKNVKALPQESDTGDNPGSYSSLVDGTTYENAIITLSADQCETDAVVTFGNNVTLTSSVSQKTLTNFKIIVNGNNVTINNVEFIHQTNTATKVIDVTTGASDVLIDNVDITLTKNVDVTTMAVSISDNADNVVVKDSNIVVNAVAQTLWHQDGEDNWYDELMVSGITVDRASNVDVHNTTVKMFNTTDTVLSGTTMPAVTVKNTANNVKLYNNTLNSTGATYVYGVMCNDFVSAINITDNKVNVTGEIYTAGIDASTTINSHVTCNKVFANSTNHEGFGYRQEALAYGVVLATYQDGNSNNNVSFNVISLVANVGYGIENYMGSNNKVDFNNVTIDAKRGLGIATNASSGNYYRNNKINITCNQDAINVFDESIPAQNVGIILINGSSNTISNNHINITETSTTTTTFAIKLDELSEENAVTNNELYVYNTNGLTKSGNSGVLNQGADNLINANYPNVEANSFNQNIKQIKADGETIIINDDNIANYGQTNGAIWMIYLNPPANAHVIIDPNSDVGSIVVQLIGVIDVQVTSKNVYSIKSGNTIVDTYLPYCNIEPGRAGMGFTIINSVFLTSSSPSDVTLVNSTILTLNNSIAYDVSNYGTYFDSNSNILSNNVPEGSNIIIRTRTGSGYQTYTKPIIINKPVNITSFDNASYNADITFVAGSEGSNITDLTLNGNLYINTSGITVRNNTIANTVFVKDTDGVVIEQNTFNTESTPIVFEGVLSSTIRDNNITTTSEYTITLDGDCEENSISGNDLTAASLTGVDSILDNGRNNVIEGGSQPVVVEPTLVVDTTEFTVGSSATITASIYLGDEVDASVNKGKVVFKVNGKTLKDQATGKVLYAKVTGGVASISDYEVPTSWANDDTTITAVYSGSSDCVALSSEATALTVTASTPSITFSDISAAKGETVTLTATVSDGDNLINTGKVVFKVNGKTVKDANGKVIYAKVTGGVASVTYTVPDSMKAGNYTITAVFTAPNYDKLTDNKTLTVTA